MAAMGIRCSNTDYAYCILSGTSTAPVVENFNRVQFPKDYSEPEKLRWFHQEMNSIFSGANCNTVGVKKAENTVTRSNALDFRIQVEAIVSLAAAEAGCLDVHRKVKSTIARDLGLKGKSRYLESKLDTTPIPDFDSYQSKVQEAVLVAWSCM